MWWCGQKECETVRSVRHSSDQVRLCFLYMLSPSFSLSPLVFFHSFFPQHDLLFSFFFSFSLTVGPHCVVIFCSGGVCCAAAGLSCRP